MAKRAGDLELHEDIQFQRREWAVQQMGWWALSAFVLAALFGLFGGGPLSRAQAGDEGSPIWIEYERFVRAGAPSRLAVHFEQTAGAPRELLFNRGYFDALRLERIVPEPERIVVGADAVSFRFAPEGAPGAHTVVFEVEPLQPGIRLVDIGAGQGRHLAFRQIVYF